MEIAPGARISPTIRLIRQLGAGGMGSVWLAEHAGLKTEVAVKLMAEKALRDADAVARFNDEAQAAARIRSPHVVQVFDHGVTDGVPFIVMELLEGEDLGFRLAREGRLDPVETLRIARQTATALAKAHAANVIHRDIKPANIFLLDVGGESFVKLLDFGVAKLAPDGAFGEGRTLSAAVFGTPHYMSPEQAESTRDVTARADLWSLSVVIYRCLTGALPFDAPTIFGLCAAIHDARFRRPTELRPGLPAAIDTWFERALTREPAARFASAVEWIESLAAAFIGTEPTLLAQELQLSERAARSGAVTKPERGAKRGEALAAPRPLSVSQSGFAPPTTPPASTAHPPTDARRSRALAAAVLALAAVGIGAGAYAVGQRSPAVASAGPIASSVPAPPSAPPAATTMAEVASGIETMPVGPLPGPVLSVRKTASRITASAVVAPLATTPTATAATTAAAPRSIDAGAPPVLRGRVAVSAASSRDLYDAAAMRSSFAATIPAMTACLDATDPSRTMTWSEVFSVTVTPTGALTSVAFKVAGSGKAAFDACTLAAVQSVGSLGPTLTGEGGTVDVGYAASGGFVRAP